LARGEPGHKRKGEGYIGGGGVKKNKKGDFFVGGTKRAVLKGKKPRG